MSNPKTFEHGIRMAMSVCEDHAKWAESREESAQSERGRLEANAWAIAARTIKNLLGDLVKEQP